MNYEENRCYAIDGTVYCYRDGFFMRSYQAKHGIGLEMKIAAKVSSVLALGISIIATFLPL